MAFVLRGGGLHSYGTYDDGVYYAAAAAFVHGRMPYRDFLFIQPPGIVIAGAPFAWLGSLIGDPAGLVAARVCFFAIGGLNAGLVAANLRRFGLPAAVIGGLFYAVFPPAVYSERSILLEPIGTLGLLAALLLVRRPGRWAAVAAGVCAGAAIDMKIWYVVPAAVIAVSVRRRAPLVVAGAAAATIAVYGPFLALDPAATIREIVLDQLGRPRTSGSLVGRLQTVVGAGRTGDMPLTLMVLLLGLLLATVLIVTGSTRGARIYAVILVANAVVLAISPPWFGHYAALTAFPIALCVGVAGGRLAGLPTAGWARAGIATVVVAIAITASEHQDRRRDGIRVDTAALRRTVAATPGCVTADDPTLLALADALTRDLRRPACQVWPDVTGWTYDADSVKAGTGRLPRRINQRWQAHVLSYLTSGSAALLSRHATGLSAASVAELTRGGVLYRTGPVVLVKTPGDR